MCVLEVVIHIYRKKERKTKCLCWDSNQQSLDEPKSNGLATVLSLLPFITRLSSWYYYAERNNFKIAFNTRTLTPTKSCLKHQSLHCIVYIMVSYPKTLVFYDCFTMIAEPKRAKRKKNELHNILFALVIALCLLPSLYH